MEQFRRIPNLGRRQLVTVTDKITGKTGVIIRELSDKTVIVFADDDTDRIADIRTLILYHADPIVKKEKVQKLDFSKFDLTTAAGIAAMRKSIEDKLANMGRL